MTHKPLRHKYLQYSLLVLIIILSFFSTISAQTITVNKPAEPPIQWPRSHNFDVQHMVLRISFDWEKEMVLGEATLRVKPFVNGLKIIELDAAKFDVKSVKLSNNNNLKYEVDPEKITITLDREYKASEVVSFTVKYSAQPKTGMTFVKPTKADPKRPYQIWSQGESQSNHEWFPCYDAPNDRATCETIVTVDSKYQVISNGELVDVKEDKAQNTKTYHWKMDYPFSSYLVSLVVGEFAELKQEANGIPIYHYVYKDQLDNAKVSFSTVPEMIKFYSAKLDQPYPYKKYAEIMAYEFPGGMENITATTMSDSSVRDKRALIDNNDSLSAHELAHQWFGDLITCRDWSELWLNEGFANFMDATWLGHAYGEEEYLRDMLEAQGAVLGRYKQGSHRPISTKRFYQPDDLFDENSYARPQIIINLLKHLLGEDAFWHSIQHYIKVNRNRGLVTTTDLSHAIEDVTGQNLDWFFDQWIYKLGQPELEITSQYDETKKQLKLIVKQTQKNDPKRPWFEVPEAYRLPVDVAITTSNGTKIQQVTITQIEETLTFPCEERPLIVNFDRGNYILKTVKFARTSDELVYQLRKDDDVTGRIRAAAELKATVYEPAVNALIAAIKEDKSSLVRLQAVDSLADNKSDVVRNALVDALNDNEWHVRQRAVVALGQFKDKNLLPVFQKVLEKDPSYKTVGAAARAVGLIASAEGTDVLLELAKQPSWQNSLTVYALAALGDSQDPRILDLALKYAAPGNERQVRTEAIYLLGSRAKGNTQALEYIRQALETQSNALGYSAVGALSEMNDKSAQDILEEYSKKKDLDSGLQGYINTVLNQIRAKTTGN
jgi:aminopeptidase N